MERKNSKKKVSSYRYSEGFGNSYRNYNAPNWNNPSALSPSSRSQAHNYNYENLGYGSYAPQSSSYYNSVGQTARTNLPVEYTSREADGGPLKLPNLGATCYISSTIQLLYTAQRNFPTDLFKLTHAPDPFTNMLYNLLTHPTESSAIWPEFLAQFYHKFPGIFISGSQDDSAKCFEHIIETILPKMVNADCIKCKVQLSQISCQRCTQQISFQGDSAPFLRFSGVSDGSVDLSEEFDSFFNYEGQCDTCGNETKETHYFKLLPDILFVVTNVEARDLKNFTEIHLRAASGDINTYQLIGASIHISYALGPTSGHYVSFVKHSEGDWYRCSDGLSERTGSIRNYFSASDYIQLMVFKRVHKNQ